MWDGESIQQEFEDEFELKRLKSTLWHDQKLIWLERLDQHLATNVNCLPQAHPITIYIHFSSLKPLLEQPTKDSKCGATPFSATAISRVGSFPSSTFKIGAMITPRVPTTNQNLMTTMVMFPWTNQLLL